MEKSKNILISCIHRRPGSCLDAFNDKMVDMYDSKSLFPAILKPTRITSGSATLIDNIFAN